MRQKNSQGQTRPADAVRTASASTRRMVRIAMIAALYAAITFVTFFLSFGAVQYRVCEVLTLLPVFTGSAIPGLTLGCAVANLVGFFTGVNPIGWIDAIVGSSATLFAAFSTRWIGRHSRGWVRYVFAPLPPVLFNAVIVGLELTLLVPTQALVLNGFWMYAASVAVGQAVVCYALGVPLMLVLARRDFYKRIFR